MNKHLKRHLIAIIIIIAISFGATALTGDLISKEVPGYPVTTSSPGNIYV